MVRLKEGAVPFLLFGCGAAAVVWRMLAGGQGEPVESAPVELDAVARWIVLGVAALGAVAWVPAGVFLMRRGLDPPKGAGKRAGVLEVIGATGVFLIAITALSAALGRGRSIPVHLGAVAAAQCAAVAYAWLRLRTFPAPFGKPVRNMCRGALAYLLISPFLVTTAVLSERAMKALNLKPEMHDALRKLFWSASPAETAAILILGVLVAPLVEEIVFRGILYGALRRKLATVPAVCASAAFFAGIHGQPGAFLPLFVLGVALALVYERTGSLAASVGLHAANNAVIFAAVMLARS